jgi:hypothetical protein
MTTFRNLIESIINVNKLKEPKSTLKKHSTEGGRGAYKGAYNKAGSYKSNVEYYQIKKKDYEEVIQVLRSNLNKSLTKTIEMDFGDGNVTKDIWYDVNISSDEYYSFVQVKLLRKDDPYFTLGLIDSKVANDIEKKVKSIVEKWLKKEVWLEKDGQLLDVIYNFNKGKQGSNGEILLTINFNGASRNVNEFSLSK